MNRPSLKTNAILYAAYKGGAILFPIVTFSYASHKLGADGIGAVNFANSVISYFLLLAALGIATYAVREGQEFREDKERLRTFISEVYTINVLMTVVSYAILGVLVLVWSKLSGYSNIIFVLSISIVLTTVGADWVNTLLEDYLFITIRFFVVQAVCLVLLITMVKGPGDVLMYAVVAMLSSVGGNLLNIVHIRRRIRFRLTHTPNFRKHFRPMLTLFSNNLAIKIYLIADVTMLGLFMTDTEVGYYSASSKVYTSVKEMLNALIFVTVPRFAYYLSHDERDSYELSYHRVFDSVGTLLLPCVVGLFFQAENILYFLGGKEYVHGTTALQILSAAMLFAVTACLFAQSILIPFKQDRFFLRATTVAAIANVVLNFLLIPRFEIEAAAVTTLISEFLVCILTFARGRKYLNGAVTVSRDIISAAVGAVGVAAVCFAMNILVTRRLSNMLLSITCSGVLYFVITLALKNHSVRKGLESAMALPGKVLKRKRKM